MLFVYLGMNLFLAQLSSHVCGVMFNYFTFRQHVFRSARPNILRYIGSYALNYVVSLAILAAFHSFVRSPYIAGLLTMATTSILNYFVLKRFVFRSGIEPRQ